MSRKARFIQISIVVGLLGIWVGRGSAAEILVGSATTNITPDRPVATCGMFELRISKIIETPLTANVVALESREGDKSLDVAVMVSCDATMIPKEVQSLVRDEVHKRLPDLDTKKVFLNATHTHTAPALSVGENAWYKIPKNGVMQTEEYLAFFAQRVADAVAQAWSGRKPGSVTWGLGHAEVARNRRGVYADGHVEMSGVRNSPDFRGLEGYEDHSVDVLFFWDGMGKPVSIVVDVSCPAQLALIRGNSINTDINADFWHPVRESLRQRYGTGVCVLGLIGAAGDQCPAQLFYMYNAAAEERMRALRKLTKLEEAARRIVCAVDEVYEAVKDDRHADVPLIHKVETIRLPMRLVTEAECIEAKAVSQQAADEIVKDPKATDRVYLLMKWNEDVVRRFERQKADPKPTFEMELHVLRIGDVAVCTNSFELFTDYGIQIKARSKATQTVVVELAGDSGFAEYLPTEKAIRGGSYSATIKSNNVGPEGGQVLVERTVELINSMWAQ